MLVPTDIEETVKMAKALNEPDVDLYVWINNLNKEGDSGGKGASGRVASIGFICDNVYFRKTILARGPSRDMANTAKVKLNNQRLSISNLNDKYIANLF